MRHSTGLEYYYQTSPVASNGSKSLQPGSKIVKSSIMRWFSLDSSGSTAKGQSPAFYSSFSNDPDFRPTGIDSERMDGSHLLCINIIICHHAVLSHSSWCSLDAVIAAVETLWVEGQCHAIFKNKHCFTAKHEESKDHMS